MRGRTRQRPHYGQNGFCTRVHARGPRPRNKEGRDISKEYQQAILEEIRRYWQEVLRENDKAELGESSSGSSEGAKKPRADRRQDLVTVAIR